jgi:D-glycero-D-manno-heptose 1,7-bisphosphate phosphatase
VNRRRAVFIDRDGTILELVPYLRRPEEVRLIAGAPDALRVLGENGWLRILVTNQSGIARGMFRMEDVEAVHDRMLELLRADGGDLDAIEVCPHHPDHSGPCSCRKPAPGMIQRAAERLDIDLTHSWVIGDRFEDLEAGRVLGARGILVLTGYGQTQALEAPSSAWLRFPHLAKNFPDACRILLRGVSKNGMEDWSPGMERRNAISG